jgi:nucleotide-binding universal stress UspA family protein
MSVDFDEYSSEALKEAAALASSGGSTVHVLHVMTISPLFDQGAAEGFTAKEAYEAQTALARKRVEEMMRAIPGKVKREIAIEIGEPGDSIVEAQKKLGADLIVMATHGRKGLKHLMLGSVAERVVREARGPVLTVRPANRNGPE